MDSAGGYSGLVLCTGTPTDQYGEAVVFQNYETTCTPYVIDTTVWLLRRGCAWGLPVDKAVYINLSIPQISFTSFLQQYTMVDIATSEI